MGGMLTAIQNFISESFQDSDTDILEEIKYGDLKIVFAHGKNIYLAVICTGEVKTKKLHKDMKNLIAVIEHKFGKVLHKWDGNMKKIKEIQELIRF